MHAAAAPPAKQAGRGGATCRIWCRQELPAREGREQAGEGLGEGAAALLARQRALEARFADLMAEQRALAQHPSKASQAANQACPRRRAQLQQSMHPCTDCLGFCRYSSNAQPWPVQRGTRGVSKACSHAIILRMQAAIKDVSEQLKQSTLQLTHTLKVRTSRPQRLSLTVPVESHDQGIACCCSTNRMPR